MQWQDKFRLATMEEVAALAALPGAPHVTYGCKCGCGTWSAKNLTLSPKGTFVPARNIFFNGDTECNCPPGDLVCIVPKESQS